ncbi:hypothetical protein Tco_1115601 [Tanacetum coccineum]
MSNTNNNLETQTSNALQNAIMETCGPSTNNPPYKFKWTEKTVPVTKGSSKTTIEWYMENYKNVSQDVSDQLNAKAEAVQIILIGIDNDIYSIVDACPNACEMWKAIERSQQATKNRGKAIVNSFDPIYDQEPATITEDDEMSKEKDRANQDNSPRINRGTRYENHRVVNIAGARENVGTQLNAEKVDWKDDIDDESDDQELEAHCMYMTQIQKVSPDAADNSGPIFNVEPLQKVQNNDHNYNVFAIENDHPEQPEYVNDTYLEEQGDTNITIDSLDMCYDREQDDQDDTDELAEERIDKNDWIRLAQESRSKLSDLIRPFDYKNLNNLYDLFVPQREKSSEQRYFSERSKMSHTPVKNENSKESFNKQTTLLEKRMDESIPWDQKCKSSKELFKIKSSVDTIFDGVERCKQTIAKRTYFGHIDPFIQNTIEGNFCPQIRRINADLEKFHLCLKEEMVADLRYFNSLEHEVDSLKSQLETQKTQFLNEIDRLSREYYYADHMNAILGVYTTLDEFTDLQCDYVDQVVKCERLEKELSKSNITSKSFEALQQHAIDLELALQQCQEQIKNDKAFKENQSKNTNVIAPGMYKVHTKPNQTRTPQLPQDIRKTNKRVSFSTGVIPTTSVSRPQLKSNRMEDRVMPNNSQGKKQEVEDHRRNFKFSNNKTSVTACNDSLNAKTSNVNFVCVTCGKCVLNDNHDMCVLHYINGVNSRTRQPIVVPISTREPKRNVNQSVATSHKKTVAT